ncbi:MAG: cytochrome c biogenesis protein ResB [Nitrospirota bacterium]
MNGIQSVRKFLLSPKAVVVMLLLVGISCLFGVSIPQTTQKSPQFFENWKLESPVVYHVIDLLQLNRVYTSVWFLIIVAVMTLSLLWFSIEQLRFLLRSRRIAGSGDIREKFDNYSEMQVSESLQEDSLSGIRDILKKRGYRISRDNEEEYSQLFSKNRVGRWGTFLFHLGLLCIIVAALYALALQKRGFVSLIHTETFSGKKEDWQTGSKGVFADDFTLDFQVHLRDFSPAYWHKGAVKSLESVLILIDKDGRREEKVLSVDSPVTHNGVRIYQSLEYGYALTFLLERPFAPPFVTHFLLDSPSRRTHPFTGKTDFPATGYIFDMKFYPDVKEPSYYLKNPVVDLVVREKDAVKFNRRVHFNEKIYIGENAFTLAQIHYWSGLFFVKSHGMTIVYSGFFLSALGAFLIYCMPYSEIRITHGEKNGKGVAIIGGRSRKYQALFADEFGKIIADMEKVFSMNTGRTDRAERVCKCEWDRANLQSSVR